MDESQTDDEGSSSASAARSDASETPDAIVVGAGIGGLGAALALERQGQSVLLLERDDTPPPTDATAAFAWDRRGAPQVRHSHAFLARLRNLLRDRFPDVLEALLAAGATELRFTDPLPETLVDQSPHEGDEDLVALACRRTTLEWVLRRIVTAEPHVQLRHGVAATGLVVAPPSDVDAAGPPTVTGVRLASGEVLAAPLVVVADGRRSPLPSWLSEVGVELPEDEEETGIVYLSRFFRLLPGAELPPSFGAVALDLGYLKYGVFPGDDRTFSVTLATRSGDDELRKRVLDPDTFLAVARAAPTVAPWVEADRAQPTTEVFVMGGLINRRRHLLDDDGAPRVLGLHVVGDAHTCTNPLYGRGCSLAMVQAVLLADALAAHPDDPAGQALAYERASAEEVLPWYRASVTQDRQNREDAAREAAAAAGDGPPPDGPDDEVDPKAFLRSLLREGLLPAVRTDAVVFRAFLRTFNLLNAPDAVVSDPEVTGRVFTVWQDHDQRPPEEPMGPDRDELLASLG